MAPNKKPMKNRVIRAGDEWDAAMEKAAERGENLSEEIRKFLIRYSNKKTESK